MESAHKLLTSHGILIREGMIRRPDRDLTNTESDAIDYLVEEWDYECI